MSLVLAAALSACGARATSGAEFPLSECRRISLSDAATGATIRGAEDLAFDPKRERLFISAYDRRAVEKAAADAAFKIPEGGVYAVAFADLAEAGSTPLRLAPLIRADAVPGGLRPHGISYAQDRDEIAFINRGYQKIDGSWLQSSNIARADGSGALLRADAPARCGANDLIDAPSGAYVTFDHGSCGWRAALEDVFSLRRSGVDHEDGETLFDGASYANGLVETASGDFVLAATREKAALILRTEGGRMVEAGRVTLPGGPDNLTLAPDGAIVAALHPSLIEMGLDRRLGLGKAGSRVVKFDPASGAVTVLFDDPSGAKFSAATVGLLWRGDLVVGSATDDGLLFCKGQG